jgi:hypothetical protein
MVAMIKAILQAKLGMLTFGIDHPLNIFESPPWWFFTKNMKVCLQPRDGNLRGKEIRQTNEQDVKFLLEQRMIIGVIPDPILKNAALLKDNVANGNNFEGGMSVNVFTPSLANYSVARYTNFELFITQLD